MLWYVKLIDGSLRFEDQLQQAFTGNVVDQRGRAIGDDASHEGEFGGKVFRRLRKRKDLFGCVLPSLSQVCQALCNLARGLDKSYDTAESADDFHGFN
jgi:hypothetical protein